MKHILTTATALLLILSARGTAQEPLRGRVTAGDQPVANQVVTLHRVSDSGMGGTVDEDTTDANGRFEVTVGEPDTSAVYFVATVYEGELYIGDTFARNYAGDYSLAVGPGAVPIRLDPAGSDDSVEELRTREDTIAGIAVILVGLLSVAGIVWLFVRPKPSPVRPMLIEVARLDEEYEQHPTEANRARRADLVRKIRETA